MKKKQQYVTVFYSNIFSNVISLCDGKAEFSETFQETFLFIIDVVNGCAA